MQFPRKERKQALIGLALLGDRAYARLEVPRAGGILHPAVYAVATALGRKAYVEGNAGFLFADARAQRREP